MVRLKAVIFKLINIYKKKNRKYDFILIYSEKANFTKTSKRHQTFLGFIKQ